MWADTQVMPGIASRTRTNRVSERMRSAGGMGARLGANRYLSLLLAPLCCVAVLVAGVSPAAAAEPSGWSWGSNLWGSLGDPSVPGQYVEMPTQVGSDTWK